MNYAFAIYALAMVAANLSVAHFGPVVAPVNAFVFIGLDLVIRDWLHERITPGKMLALILATGALSYVLNPAAGHIAVASTTAFVAAALADWLVFARMRGSWFFRSNTSNLAGAAVDSIVFPTMAFGGLMPGLVLAQFVAKVAGGALWALALKKWGGAR